MKRKLLSLFLALTMTVSLFTVGANAAEPIYRDTNGHWAAETIEGFSRLGLIEGYNGQFFPNNKITRGEMAVILNRLMSYQTASANSFSDLGDAFYTDAVLKANAAGVMLGSNGTVRPTDPITRQEAAVLLCRALGLEGGGSVAQFSDRGQIASWAADAVGVMAAKKLLQGANGMFRPADAITRAETVAILDRALGKLVSEGESASGRVDGDVVIRGAGAKLSDMTINGDLIIAEGVGEGEVHLDGVTITGRTIVRGGGVNSIYMNNVRANGGVVVNKLDGKVRVVTSGNTTVSVTLLQSGAILVGDGFKTVEIPADVAKGQTVEIQGNIERLVNSSENVEITANGTIQTVEANVKTEIKGDAKVVGATGSADVKVNGSAVAKTDKPAAGGNGGSGGSSGGNSSTASKEIKGAAPIEDVKVPYGTSADDALKALPKTVTLNLKDGSTTSATVTKWEWDKNSAYNATPTTKPASTPAVATVTIPSGYTYNGTLTATASVTVLLLDKDKLITAIGDAHTELNKLTDIEEYAVGDKILHTDKTSDKITAGVRFTTNAAMEAFKAAISTAESAVNTDFASQSDCDKAAKALQAAMKTFQESIKIGTLNKQAFHDALKAAQAVIDNTVTDEKTAAKENKILIIDNKTAADITQGVRFTTNASKDALKDAINKAESVKNIDSASQTDYDNAAKELRDAITAFEESIKTGESIQTNEYILQYVKKELLRPDGGDFPYASHMQPLKPGSAYPLAGIDGYTVPTNKVGVYIKWEAMGEGKQYVEKISGPRDNDDILGYFYSGKIRNTVSKGVLIKSAAPDKPTKVSFKATVKNAQTDDVIGTLGENGEYSATIGAPISATKPIDVPHFTAVSDSTSTTGATKFTGVVPITLNGAEAIESVSDGCVTMADSNKNVTDNEVSLSSIHVDQVEKSDTGLNVTVTVTTGGIGGVWSGNSPYPFKEGKLTNISIDTSKFQLEENTFGWYLPTDNTLKLPDMTVDVLTPAFTGVDRADDPTTGNPTFTIHTQNMPENAKVEVALAKTSVGAADIEKATIKKDATRGSDGKYSVTFDKNAFESGAEYYLWFRYGAPDSDWAYPDNNRPTYTPNRTTSGGGESGGTGTEGGSESGGGTGGGSTGGSDSGNTTEGSQAGA